MEDHSEYRTGLMSLCGRNWVYLRNSQEVSVAGAEFKKQLSLKKSWDKGPRQWGSGLLYWGRPFPLHPVFAPGQCLPRTNRTPIFLQEVRNSDSKNVQSPNFQMLKMNSRENKIYLKLSVCR